MIGKVTRQNISKRRSVCIDAILSLCVCVCVDGEDAETIVAYSLKLLDTRTNIVIESGKRINESTNVRVVDHASNVMDLSYTANQVGSGYA